MQRESTSKGSFKKATSSPSPSSFSLKNEHSKHLNEKKITRINQEKIRILAEANQKRKEKKKQIEKENELKKLRNIQKKSQI
jgi:hypothetical protein